MAGTTIEIINGRERCRRWSIEDKLQMVGTKQEPANHDIYPGCLCTWRRQASEETLAPAQCQCSCRSVVARVQRRQTPVSTETPAPHASGQIEGALQDGTFPHTGYGLLAVAHSPGMPYLRQIKQPRASGRLFC